MRSYLHLTFKKLKSSLHIKTFKCSFQLSVRSFQICLRERDYLVFFSCLWRIVTLHCFGQYWLPVTMKVCGQWPEFLSFKEMDCWKIFSLTHTHMHNWSGNKNRCVIRMQRQLKYCAMSWATDPYTMPLKINISLENMFRGYSCILCLSLWDDRLHVMCKRVFTCDTLDCVSVMLVAFLQCL